MISKQALSGFLGAVALVVTGYCSAIGLGDLDMEKGAALLKKVEDNKTLLKGFSREEELDIGRQLTGSILGAAPLVSDAKLQAYVNRVGRWVAQQSDRRKLPWTFGVVDSTIINAFAAPGGYILVTRGLLAELDSEAQLAAVLGHEIAHVVEKHHLDLMRKSTVVNKASEAAKEYAGGEQQAMIQQMIGQGAEIMARSLDRGSEYDADRIGMRLATEAGYTPLGMAEVAMKLAAKSQQDSHMALLFSTHPSPRDRLDQLDEVMEKKKFVDALERPELRERFAKALHK